MYCPKCRIVFDRERCPACGNKKTRHPLPEDACFLTEVDGIWSGMLSDVLRQNGIPALSQSTIGAAMAMHAGTMFERFRFFVRYEHLARASEIAEALFSVPQAEETDGE